MERRIQGAPKPIFIGLIGLVAALSGCSASAAAPSSEPAEAVPTVSAQASPTYHRPPTPRPVPTTTVPSATAPAADIEPGEPWIVYQAGTDHDTILLARNDGSDSHLVWGSDSSVSGLGQWHPDWSPDGATIAFTNEYFGAKDIWLVDAAGTDPRVLYDGPSQMPFVDFPAFSPDGTQIVAASYNWEPTVSVSRRSALILIDTASGRADEISVLEGTHTVYAYPRWSPDGDALVVSIGKFDETDTTWLGEAIAILRRTDTGWSKPKVITDFAAFGSYPDWSPAGDRIVFAAHDPGWFINIVNNSGLSVDLTGITPDLFTVRPDGSRLKQITHTAKDDATAGQPSWTSDGRIIFTYSPGPHDHRTAFLDADGSGLRVLHGFATHSRLRPSAD